MDRNTSAHIMRSGTASPGRVPGPVLGLLLLTLSACSLGVNEDIDIPAGQEHDGGMTVNGDIDVGDDARVSGDLRTVNGRISVGSGARVQDLNTVNGQVRLYDGARLRSAEVVNGSIMGGRDLQVSRDLSSVNGRIELEAGSVVQGGLRTVNGEIVLYRSEVHGWVENHNGGMRIMDGSILHAGLEVHEPDGDTGSEPPRIVIGEGAQVRGPMIFDREVLLFVHETAEVGEITGAEAERFGGEPPR